MGYFEAIILSFVEGITEFLPISSTGHLILTSDLLKIRQTDFVKSFEIFIQLGAILAVVALYGKNFLQSKKIWQRIIAAFIPTAFVGLVFYQIVKDFFLGNTIVTLWALFIGGIVLIFLEKGKGETENKIESIESISIKKSFLIGLFQSVSLVPGVSRAAATIIGGMLLGFKRKAAVEFSFLLAVPTMLAATGLDLIKSEFVFSAKEYLIFGIGFLGAFLTAWLTIKYFIKFIQRHNFVAFGVYRIIISLFFWIIIMS